MDLATEVGQKLFDMWFASAQDASFRGDWTNERGQVSADPLVRGHRHDQSALDLISHVLELESLPRMAVAQFGGEPLRDQVLRIRKGLD